MSLWCTFVTSILILDIGQKRVAFPCWELRLVIMHAFEQSGQKEKEKPTCQRKSEA